MRDTEAEDTIDFVVWLVGVVFVGACSLYVLHFLRRIAVALEAMG